MGFLIDTNVLSELRKGSKMDKNVREWFEAVPSDVERLTGVNL